MIFGELNDNNPENHMFENMTHRNGWFNEGYMQEIWCCWLIAHMIASLERVQELNENDTKDLKTAIRTIYNFIPKQEHLEEAMIVKPLP